VIETSGNADGDGPVRATAPAAQIFVADRESETTIRHCLDDLGIHDALYTQGTVEAAVTALANESSPRLLIVDVSDVDDAIARIHKLAEVCKPNTGVIVIGNRNDVILYRNLRHAGVAEYFFKPLVMDPVRLACESILTGGRDAQQSAAHSAKLVFFVGVRGGIGSTTIAVNTAWHLAEIRRYLVMLLDLDLQGGDAALQLDATPTNALREAFAHPERVDRLFLERAVIHVDQRLDLLASLESLGASALDEGAVLSLLNSVLPRYRFILVDMPADVAVRLPRVLQLPSTCVLVSGASLASARDVARWRERIGPNSNERITLHILNQSGAYGSLPQEEFIRAAGCIPDIVIPYSREIGNASNLGVKGAQKCAALKRALAPLIRDLAGQPAEMPRSLLHRIFG